MSRSSPRHKYRGLGGVIATLFVAVMIVTSGVLYFTLSGAAEQIWRRAQYSQTNEMVVAATEAFTMLSTQGAENRIVVNVTNHGSIPIRIVAVVVNYTTSNAVYKDRASSPATSPPLPLTVNPGQTEGLDTGITNPGSTYSIKILSERGNEALLALAGSGAGGGIPPENVVTLRVAGNLTMAFFEIQWRQYISGAWTPWQKGTLLSGLKDTIWRVLITNNLKENINFSKYSVLMLAAAGAGGQRRGFWIIDPDDGEAGSISDAYVDYSLTIAPNATAWVYFAAKENKVQLQNMPSAGTQAAAFILLYGLVDGKTWGQNIPYQGVYTT